MSRLKKISHSPQVSQPKTQAAESSVSVGDVSLTGGDRVRHDRFGTGTVVSVAGKGQDAKAVVSFDAGGEKTLLLKYARLQKI